MKRYWVTGASSGIGLEIARQLAARGDIVFASSRGIESLAANIAESNDSSGKIIPLRCDVANASSVDSAIESINAQQNGLDVVILNAGICEYIDVKAPDLDAFERVMQTNFHGLVRCAFAAIPLLQASRGRVVGVISAAAYSGMPRAEAYGSSKAAVAHFLESLRVDMASTGVSVTSVFPGFVETPLSDLNDFPMPMRISAVQASERIIKAVDRGRDEVHFPWIFCALLRLIARLPSPLRTKVFARMVRTDEHSS